MLHGSQRKPAEKKHPTKQMLLQLIQSKRKKVVVASRISVMSRARIRKMSSSALRVKNVAKVVIKDVQTAIIANPNQVIKDEDHVFVLPDLHSVIGL